MLNFKYLYPPNEDLDFSKRIDLHLPVNPLFHEEMNTNVIYYLRDKSLNKVSEALNEETSIQWSIKFSTEDDHPSLSVIKKPHAALHERVAEKDANNDSHIIKINLHALEENLKKWELFGKTNGSKMAEYKNKLNTKKKLHKKDDRDYERQNVYYKTLLRDFKKFISKDYEVYWVSQSTRKGQAATKGYFCMKSHARVNVMNQNLMDYIKYLVAENSHNIGKWQVMFQF
jgi:hypothetical protein